MKLFYGHYPSIENHFIRFVQTKHNTPADKWLVVCASSWIAKRLQSQLAKQLGIVANLHFTSPRGLITRLSQENTAPSLPLFPQDHLRDFLIKEILTEPGLNRYPVSHGFVQAVKSALRDLADSLADPYILEEHVRNMPDFALQADAGHFAWLIRLYRRYCEKENTIPGYCSYQQVFETALAGVDTSAYLQSFSQIIIYGFYDMSGRQLELIQHLKNTYPLTVFAPYTTHPAYRFAKIFFETNWLGSAEAQPITVSAPTALGNATPFLFANEGSASANQLTLAEAPDPSGAVFYTAKEILRLHEKEHIPFDQMAILARTMTPYQEEIQRVFAGNCIPLNATFTYPLSKHPLGTFCITVFSLQQQGFSRDKIISVLSSPYFKSLEKNDWKQAVRNSAVNRDLSQWQDLFSQATGTQAALLHWIENIAQHLEQLSLPQPWETGIHKALVFLDSLIDTAAFIEKDTAIYQTIRQALTEISSYSALRAQSKPGELIQEILEVLISLTYSETQAFPHGVTVTDCIQARGLSFHTVFVLGLNDGEFPLITTEDPILRDYYRFILRDTLGYWINASLDRIAEERLLFYTTLTSAQQNLYVLTARQTFEGKPAVPSIYLAELARACGQTLPSEKVYRLSGYLSERLANCPLEFLTPKELSYRFILHPQTALQHYQQAGLFTPQKATSLTAARALSTYGELSPFDGLIQQGRLLFKKENEKGFSPSALQELGTCPFKYFAKRGLHLAEPQAPLSRQELAADERGSALHFVLKEFYEMLNRQHLTPDLLDKAAETYIHQILYKIYPAAAYRRFGIYPVVWELLVEQMEHTLTQFVREDIKNLQGFVPTYFEQEVHAVPTSQFPLLLHGFIDRIDVLEAHHQLRIIDYKSTRKGTANLARDLFTRLTLQPFMYWLMLLQTDFLKEYTPKEACLLTLAQYKKQTLSSEEFEAVRNTACQLLQLLARLIEQGTFFINPSKACAYCPYALLCRKDAFKPLLRARKSKPAAALEEARQ